MRHKERGEDQQSHVGDGLENHPHVRTLDATTARPLDRLQVDEVALLHKYMVILVMITMAIMILVMITMAIMIVLMMIIQPGRRSCSPT